MSTCLLVEVIDTRRGALLASHPVGEGGGRFIPGTDLFYRRFEGPDGVTTFTIFSVRLVEN
jgi:hypothetical protein